MNDQFSNLTKDHTGAWVALFSSIIGAAGLIIAAIIGVDAKHDREAADLTKARSALAAKDVEIQSLQTEIQKLKPNQPTNSGDIGAPRELTLTTLPVKKEEEGISFELQGCRSSGTEITCDFLVTDIKNDHKVTLCSPCTGSRSRIVDVSGNEYIGQTAILGQSSGLEPAAKLTKGIPLKASITFGRVGPAFGIKLLEVWFSIRHFFRVRDYKVQFHDIQLSGA
ncbi:MAG: hypothetical protein ACJ76Y_24615 [Thermoanaerobaculia bacterium]